MMNKSNVIAIALLILVHPSCCSASTISNGNRFGIRKLATSTAKAQTETNSRNSRLECLGRVGLVGASCLGMSVLAPILLVSAEALGNDAAECIKAGAAFTPSVLTWFQKRTTNGVDLLIQTYIVKPVATDEKENGTKFVLSFPVQCVLFSIASIDAFIAIATNRNAAIKGTNTPGEILKEVASDIISFWKVSPQELFAIGAGLRALQLCTALQYSFDPSVGVAALINFGATVLKWRWLAQLVVGWTITPNLWKLCGARQPKGSEKDMRSS